MKMLVLAGGFGTRLNSIMSETPKALAPVDGIPFLYLQIKHWIAQGQTSFVFLLHHKADQIIEFLNGQKSGLLKECYVQWVVEPVPLDTGGAVAYAIQQLKLSDSFLLINADTWLGTGLRELSIAVAPAIAVTKVLDSSRYGRVQLKHQGVVNAFLEKSTIPISGFINAGLCHLNVNIFQNWDNKPFSLEKIIFPRLSESGTLTAVELDSTFIDIGIPEDYNWFCRMVEEGRIGNLCS
jgi:NDP-sugar pyrophosphorylase family protein